MTADLYWRPLGGNNPQDLGGGNCHLYWSQGGEGHSPDPAQGTAFLIDCGIGEVKSKAGDAVPVPPVFADGGRGPLKAVFLTHGHRDHIGAVPELIKQGRDIGTVYGSAYTLKILEYYLARDGIDPARWPPRRKMGPGDAITLGTGETAATVTAIGASHSIPGSLSFAIEAAGRRVVHTSDITREQGLVLTHNTDFAALSAFGKKGVDMMLADAAKAMEPGSIPTAQDVIDSAAEVATTHPDRPMVFAGPGAGHANYIEIAGRAAAQSGRALVIHGTSQRLYAAALDQILREDGSSLEEALGTPVLDGESEAAGKLPAHRALHFLDGGRAKTSSTLGQAVRGELASLHLTGREVVFMSAGYSGEKAAKIDHLMQPLKDRGAIVVTGADQVTYTPGHETAAGFAAIAATVSPGIVVPTHHKVKKTGAFDAVAAAAGLRTVDDVPLNGSTWKVTPGGLEKAGDGDMPWVPATAAQEEEFEAPPPGTLGVRAHRPSVTRP